jgi:cyclic pyranopterin phosphate synthase
MVDVGAKKPQHRTARAAGMLATSAATRDLIRQSQIRKGDVFTVAQIAGIQAAKRTADMIPLCHPLVLDKIDVRLDLTEEGVSAASEVSAIGRTGVEMEALIAVSVALLTVYDMCKAVDPAMRIQHVALVEKVKADVQEH